MLAVWDQLVLAVCRPPRDVYSGEEDLVGGKRASFRLGKKKYYRQDVQLTNPRGLKIQASHYRPCVVTSRDGRLPCVVYCHCNSGSRRDAEEILYHVLPRSITVFALDFTGSGQSEGEYVTLGAHEVEDLGTAVQYLREEGSTSTIGLWGRSMGAVTALLYSQRDPSVAGMVSKLGGLEGMVSELGGGEYYISGRGVFTLRAAWLVATYCEVLDSPFSRLSDLMMELAMDQQLRIPKPLLKVALAMMRRSVRKRAGFDIDYVSPLDRAKESFIPALFGHAKEDTFVNKHHSERLFAAHAGDKNFITFDGDHNSVRPDIFYTSALIFMMGALRVEELVGPDVDLHSLEDFALPHMASRENSIYVASRTSGASGASSPTLEEAANAAVAAARGQGEAPSPRSSGGVSTTSQFASHLNSPSLARTLTPPWDRAQMPGQPRRGAGASFEKEFATAVAQASAALAAGRQQQQGVGGRGRVTAVSLGSSSSGASSPRPQVTVTPVGASAATAGAGAQLQAVPAAGFLRPTLSNPEHGAQYTLDEETALQQALEMSLRDMQQQQQQGGPQQDGAQVPQHRRYNPLYSSSGPENPLYGRSVGAETPLTGEDEEAMLARAIAESLRLHGGAESPRQQSPRQPPARQHPAEQGQPVKQLAALQHLKPRPRGVESPHRLTHSPRLGHGANSAIAQNSASEHAEQEAAAVRRASTDLKQVMEEAAAACEANGSAGSSVTDGFEGPNKGGSATTSHQQQQQQTQHANAVWESSATPEADEDKLQRLRAEAAAVCKGFT
ncbi:hypothetical protein N2152v2_000019 [Parachlorella kessleri]